MTFLQSYFQAKEGYRRSTRNNVRQVTALELIFSERRIEKT